MAVRVFLPGTEKPLKRERAEPISAQPQVRMLPGEHDRRRKPALGKRVRDRRQLDQFGPGADDQADIRETQPSP
jgi:hypothetical protein